MAVWDYISSLERGCVAAETDRGVTRLPRRWGCQATAPPIDTVAGPPRRGAKPLPRSPLLPAPPHSCLERECLAAEVDRGVARPRRWGRQATASPIDNVAGPLRRGAPPPSPLPPPTCAAALWGSAPSPQPPPTCAAAPLP
jgi:hypothetical protein